MDVKQLRHPDAAQSVSGNGGMLESEHRPHRFPQFADDEYAIKAFGLGNLAFLMTFAEANF